jgi:predicted DNA-binding transcriptional regulator AlpA
VSPETRIDKDAIKRIRSVMDSEGLDFHAAALKIQERSKEVLEKSAEDGNVTGVQLQITTAQASRSEQHPLESLLNEKEAASLLGVSVAQLRNWRFGRGGPGPKFVKISASVRYRQDHLRQFIESLPVCGGAQ